MKYLLLVLPCVIAVVLVRAQVPGASVGPVGGGGGFGTAGGFGGVGGGGNPGDLPVVYYPYPSPPRRGSLGPILQEIQAENARAFAANLCEYKLHLLDLK